MMTTSKGTVTDFRRISTTPPLNDNMVEVYLKKETVPTTPPLDDSTSEVDLKEETADVDTYTHTHEMGVTGNKNRTMIVGSPVPMSPGGEAGLPSSGRAEPDLGPLEDRTLSPTPHAPSHSCAAAPDEL